MRALVISAPASGQGKTTVTLGLLRAFRNRGVRIVSGKSGPDYIDPAYHEAATGRPCVTLDAWAGSGQQVRGRAAMLSQDPSGGGASDLMIVEGAMGLFDGAAGTRGIGRGSTAELASALDAPVILVVNCSHMAQSVGALVAGMQAWSETAEVNLAGVVLNRIGSARHEALVRGAIEPACPVLGAIPRAETLTLPSRHLGLVQAGEHAAIDAFIENAAERVAVHCDLDAIAAIARHRQDRGRITLIRPLGQRIAVARDMAFAFSYWHMLEDWQATGCEIVPFSPLAGEGPDKAADAVFLPGGYPELHAGRLAASGFLPALRAAADRGALIYGECGGYMVLGEGLVDADGHRHRMAGLLALETSFADRRLHLGYRYLDVLTGPWTGAMAAHEFHYSATLSEAGEPFCRMHDATGNDLGTAGLVAGRVMGSFAHVIEPG